MCFVRVRAVFNARVPSIPCARLYACSTLYQWCIAWTVHKQADRALAPDDDEAQVTLESLLSPGQGWHRRANAQKRYKSSPNGQPIN